MARGPGLEPGSAAPKAAVLPIRRSPKKQLTGPKILSESYLDVKRSNCKIKYFAIKHKSQDLFCYRLGCQKGECMLSWLG